jgi:hypothetical protein
VATPSSLSATISHMVRTFNSGHRPFAYGVSRPRRVDATLLAVTTRPACLLGEIFVYHTGVVRGAERPPPPPPNGGKKMLSKLLTLLVLILEIVKLVLERYSGQ